MSGNGMGGRRIGKKYWLNPTEKYVSARGNTLDERGSTGLNVEEDSYYDVPYTPSGLSEMEKLIQDYNRQNKFIKWQKKHWLPPKEKKTK